MKKLSVSALLLVALTPSVSMANGSADVLLERGKTLEEMKFQSDKLEIQAQMAKSFQSMTEAGFIVAEDGTPIGIGDMERLAMEVRLGARKPSEPTFNPSDPFGGASPIVPMAPEPGGMFGSRAPAPAEPASAPPEAVEVVSKPTEQEKAEGKKVLALAEVRSNSVLLFTNNGFEDVGIGGRVYDMRVKSIGVDSVTLDGPDGNRVLRIDWTKSVRYSDD
tara:strand:- start:78093 stop:78752 length:660 start_codon:yes stop_codon:yes gene_type:complete